MCAQELWLHLNPQYDFNNIGMRPELHFRKDLSTGLDTKIIKGNFLIKDFLIGAAYFHFPSSKNERRFYVGHFKRLRKWTFREIIELRSFNNSTDQGRLRIKIDFRWKESIHPTTEILYQFGKRDSFELRFGISLVHKIQSHRITLTPAIITSQFASPRYIVMISEYF